MHFYNTRDKYAYPVTSGHCPKGTTEKVDCWPMPEVRNNIDMTSGNLGLTDEEENQIVAFLQTLSDGFTRPYLNIDTLYGRLLEGWFSRDPRQRAPDRYSAVATVRTRYLRHCSCPQPTDPIAEGWESQDYKLIVILRGVNMSRALAIWAIAVLGGSLCAQVSPTTPEAAQVRIIEGPRIELARKYLTIISWTTNNPGGSPVHYGVVRYGTDPNRPIETAKSPIRLNPDHSSTVFRVRLDSLRPQTTYFYTVDSMQANGKSDGVKSSVNHFTTP